MGIRSLVEYLIKKHMEEARYYTSCEEIPLYNFMEMYKGNLKFLIKKGKPKENELKEASMRLIDEYAKITGNKNIAIEIDDRAKMIDYSNKLILLDMAVNLINAWMFLEAKDILRALGMNITDKPSGQEIMVALRNIESLKARIGLSKVMLEKRFKSSVKIDPSLKNFTRERMLVSAHFSMRIDPHTYTAAEYGNLIKIMMEQIKETKSDGKRD